MAAPTLDRIRARAVLPERAATDRGWPGRRAGAGVSRRAACDPSLARLAEAILVPPFPGTTVPGWLLAALGRGLAGVTLFGPNVSDPDQLAALTSQLQNAADEPVIAIDEEGGDVTRLAHRTGSPYPGSAALGAIDDTELTAQMYRALGCDLAAAGINTNLAPSADVNSAAGQPGHRHPVVRRGHRPGRQARRGRGDRPAVLGRRRLRQALPRARQHQGRQPSRDRRGGRRPGRAAAAGPAAVRGGDRRGRAGGHARAPARPRAHRRPARHLVGCRADRPAPRRARLHRGDRVRCPGDARGQRPARRARGSRARGRGGRRPALPRP